MVPMPSRRALVSFEPWTQLRYPLDLTIFSYDPPSVCSEERFLWGGVKYCIYIKGRKIKCMERYHWAERIARAFNAGSVVAVAGLVSSRS